MNRSLVRAAACTLAAAAFTLILLTVSTSAQAASLGFPDSCTMSGPDISGNFTLTCPTSGGPSAPSSCTLSAIPTSLSAGGGTVALTMDCLSGDPATSYTWTSTTSATSFSTTTASGSQSPGITASTTFTAVANSATGLHSVTKSLLVSVGAPPPPPPGGIDTSACTALGLNPKVITAAWTGNTILYTSSAGNFGPNDAVIVQFTTSSVTTSTSGGSISAVQYVDPDTSRSWALSDKPCDFTAGLNLYKMKGTPAVQTQCKNFDGTAQRSASTGSISPQNGFTVANAGASCNPILNAGQTYFWNLTNFAPAPGIAGSTQQCNLTHCNMIITLTKPSGT